MNIDADLVHEQLVNGAMKGNAGKTLAFYVTLKNRRHAIGGTYVDGAKDHHSCVGQRRFTWFFKHPGALALAVYHSLDEDSKWVDLFYDEKSIFLSTKRRGCPMRLSLQQVPWKLIVSLLLALLLMTSLIMMLVDAPSYPVNVSS